MIVLEILATILGVLATMYLLLALVKPERF
ncbi:potassium-transporting ATPase subunit F [Micrococcus luteus]|nr:potassium-transporting ATPase subunit F [Micrococcus luteus]UTX35134.1 potassium-transporting ATPase subunit F [Micrococcus luteus]